MKKGGVIAIAVIALLGAGFAAYWFLFRKQKPVGNTSPQRDTTIYDQNGVPFNSGVVGPRALPNQQPILNAATGQPPVVPVNSIKLQDGQIVTTQQAVAMINAGQPVIDQAGQPYTVKKVLGGGKIEFMLAPAGPTNFTGDVNRFNGNQ